jgi:hypothetical protein
MSVSPSYSILTNHTLRIDSQRLTNFHPKVQNTILRLHLRREYVSLDHILDEIERWTLIEQLFYLEFLYARQSGCIDQAVACQPQYMVEAGMRKLRVDFRFTLPDPVMPALPPILYFVELDSRQWHDRTPKEFANGRRRMRVLQRQGGRAYSFAGSEVLRNAAACVLETVGAMEADLIERRHLTRLVTLSASSSARL